MTDRLPPLHAVHDARGAKFTDFGGWQMPVEFDSIREEHDAVRESVGIFDVSHMGEIEVSGPDATALMNRLTTNDVSALDPGDSQYAAITTEEGVMLDDTVVYRLPDGVAAGTGAAALADLDRDLDEPAADPAHPAYLFVPNAGHDEQMYDRWVDYRDDEGLDAAVENVTDDWAMLAVQGPDAADALDDATPADRVVGLSKFEATVAAVGGVDSWVARTGYTGEDGFEVMCPTGDAESVWGAFADSPREAQPCGLGARDTLRTEMGYLLSGQDFDPDEEPRTPYEARIGFVVKLDTEFVGRDALEVQKEEGVEEKFVGVRLLDRGVPRGGYAVTDGDLTRIGHLTSGTMSPTLNEPIGLGYLHESHAQADTEVSVVVRGDEKRAEVVIPPFVDR